MAAAVDRPTRVRFAVVALTLILVAIAYLDRVCISTAAPIIQRDLALDDGQMGLVFSAFTLAYAVFEVPSGWLADRFGARLALSRIVVVWSAMTAATGLATGFASMIVVRLLFGAGEAGAFPATARVYARWLPKNARGRAFGVAIMTGAVGGALTQPLVVALLGVMSWRRTFALLGSVGLVWAAAWWLFFRDDPRTHPRVNARELEAIQGPPSLGDAPPTPASGHHAVPWRALARSRTVIALAVMYTGAIYGWYFFLTWLPTYLLRARGFDLHQTGRLAAVPLLGIAAGVFVGGFASDALVRILGWRLGRASLGVVGFPLAAAAILGATTTASPLTSVWLLAAAAALAALGVAPAWATCLDIGGPHAGVVSGAMNTFGNVGGALLPVVVGFCLRRWGSWEIPLYSVAGFYLVSAACWLFVDPRRAIEGVT